MYKNSDRRQKLDEADTHSHNEEFNDEQNGAIEAEIVRHQTE
jgi:hypothetical protein